MRFLGAIASSLDYMPSSLDYRDHCLIESFLPSPPRNTLIEGIWTSDIDIQQVLIHLYLTRDDHSDYPGRNQADPRSASTKHKRIKTHTTPAESSPQRLPPIPELHLFCRSVRQAMHALKSAEMELDETYNTRLQQNDRFYAEARRMTAMAGRVIQRYKLQEYAAAAASSSSSTSDEFSNNAPIPPLVAESTTASEPETQWAAWPLLHEAAQAVLSLFMLRARAGVAEPICQRTKKKSDTTTWTVSRLDVSPRRIGSLLAQRDLQGYIRPTRESQAS